MAVSGKGIALFIPGSYQHHQTCKSMSLLQSLNNPSLQISSPSKSTSHFFDFHHTKFSFLTCSPKPSSRNHRNLIPVLAYSGTDSKSTPAYGFLESLSRTNSEKLPAVRTYENDLGRLVLIGEVVSEQAILAAAADGGAAAEEHIVSGLPTMVVETVYPGSSGEHSTVSTRLFLPARKVKEKAGKLRSSFNVDILSSTTSRNILAMTFRQVVLQRLWSFELSLFASGNERNMAELANPRGVTVFCSLSSSDDRVVSALAEAVCTCALESVKNDFHRFWKPKMISSADSSVYVCEISQDEVALKAKNIVGGFDPIKGKERVREEKSTRAWWPSPIYSRVDQSGGSSNWIRDYVPAYRLQVDADKFKDVKFKGWKKSANNRWEVLLSHSQMVGLADVLDMYYEDIYAIPGKQLPCRTIAEFSNLSKSKSSLWKILFITLTGGFVIASMSILAQFCWPQLMKPRKSTTESHSTSLADVDLSQLQSEATKPIILSNVEASDAIGALCISVVKAITEALGWPGDIMVDPDVGAWIGEIPNYLKLRNEELVQEVASGCEGAATRSSSGDVPMDAQDIASYQVVLTREGKIVGFQPTSRVGVNHWASNPLAKSLYGGRKLSPGFLEPNLKIPRPDEVFLMELLMSTNPATQFALARPIR